MARSFRIAAEDSRINGSGFFDPLLTGGGHTFQVVVECGPAFGDACIAFGTDGGTLLLESRGGRAFLLRGRTGPLTAFLFDLTLDLLPGERNAGTTLFIDRENRFELVCHRTASTSSSSCRSSAGGRARVTGGEVECHSMAVTRFVAIAVEAGDLICMIVFANRRGAGRQLSERLAHLSGRDDVVVLALPRGGVPVGFAIAERLRVPLDVFVVRKIGVPGQNELALGAIASGDVIVFNEDVMSRLHLPGAAVQFAISQARMELARREKLYRGDQPRIDVRGKTVIVVDDGLATGATMRAAVQALRRRSPSRIIAAVPVGAEESVNAVRAEADEVICLSTPYDFRAVSLWYVDFAQITDGEVRALLSHSVDRIVMQSHATA